LSKDVRYFISDHPGSTTALTGAAGAVTASQAYDAFGNGDNPAFPTRYQYTGREFEPVTGLYYYRARAYDPKLGRFTSEDPIGFAGGDLNWYGYVLNRPTMLRDPFGLQVPVWDHYWYWYYSKKCAESGIASACDINRSGGNPEQLAQEAFNRGVGSISGLRFKVGFGDTFPTNVQRVHPNGEIDDTLVNVAKTQKLGKVDRFLAWVDSLF
jgi:RHS repeat-associated protein